MKPLFFNPHVDRNPCGEIPLGPVYEFLSPRMMDQYYLHDASARYRRNAPFGVGTAGGSAVVSEVITRRSVQEAARGPDVVAQVTTEQPGRRVTVTTQRLEIVTTVTTLTSVVSSAGARPEGAKPERAQPKASE